MSSKINRASMFGVGVLIIVYSVGTHVLAQTVQAPEIDGGSIVTGLGLLTAGVLIVRSRWGSK
jgi:hypothetical protein